tara:strand:+ start:567 stop:1694 length:1128 start_codon:yes stop_codon:yes gene_type:complete
MAFPSVYEMTNPLTTVRKQHFWEYFSGSQLPTYSAPATTSNISWDSSTDVNVSISGNTVTATGGTAWDKFAQSTQTFTPSDSPTLEYTSNASYYNMTGFGKGAAIQNGNYYGSLSFGIYSMSGSIAIYENGAQVHVGGSHSSTDVLKVTMDSNGLVKYYSGSTLIYTSTQTASGSYDVRFAGYHTNASVTATATTSSSLGDRWTQTNVTGTGTFAMSDEADGGYSVKSGATTNNQSNIDFNNINQYSQTASVFICVFKRVTANSFVTFGGMTLNTDNDRNLAKITNDTSLTNLGLRTGDASSVSTTEGSVANHTNFTVGKIECGSANIKSYIDGVLDVTKTTSRPADALQPFCLTFARTASAGEGRFKYFEAYNT